MPRGPGKSENYNLNYHRFSSLETEEDAAAAAGADAAEPLVMDRELWQAMGQMPPELQEAFRLMQISKVSGDVEAQRRANELALAAVEKGGPEVRQRFMNEVSRMNPEAASLLADPGSKPAKDSLTREAVASSPGAVKKNLSELEKTMRKGQEDARRQLDSLQRQQEQLENLKSPEDFFKFMQGGGMSEEDMQRSFAGDEDHMKAVIQRMINQAAVPDEGCKESAEAALQAANVITEVLTGKGEDAPEGSRESLLEDFRESLAISDTLAGAPQVAIPENRLQYRKGADGKYEAVELLVELPGVADMGAVSLDVSERHMRLVTSAPAPLFVVNVGPFPVLVDAAAAKAKFSKKRQVLLVVVPVAD